MLSGVTDCGQGAKKPMILVRGSRADPPSITHTHTHTHTQVRSNDCGQWVPIVVRILVRDLGFGSRILVRGSRPPIVIQGSRPRNLVRGSRPKMMVGGAGL